MRLMQASITNATVLYNLATENEKKLGTKDFALKISEQYLRSSERKKYKNHSLEITIRYCSREKCNVRMLKSCKECEEFILLYKMFQRDPQLNDFR